MFSSMMLVVLTGATIDPELAQTLATLGPNEAITAVAEMADDPDVVGLKAKYGDDLKALFDREREFCARSQESLLSFLNAQPDVRNVQGFWTSNLVIFDAPRSVILQVADRTDVALVRPEAKVYLIDDLGVTQPAASPDLIAWGVTQINAPQVWDLGYTGQNVLVGDMDTGFQDGHPALMPSYSGLWKDVITSWSTPHDGYGHGTHTNGTICGGDGRGSFTYDVGVAPDATFAHVRIFNDSGGTTESAIHNGFAQFVTWKVDSGYNIRAVNNSWGSSSTTRTVFWPDVDNWRAANIVPVFSIGNSGPGGGTAGTPGNFPTVIGVGATSSSDVIASFSSRGPAPSIPPWNDTTNWSRPDWNYVKPDVSAPGVNVYSSYPTNSYTTMSGTSMAAPHVVGAIAVLLSYDSTLTYTDLYNVLFYTCYQPSWGAPYPNNDYGNGRIDLLAAINDLSTHERGASASVLSLSVMPNPTAGEARVTFSLPEATTGEVTVYDLSGRVAAKLTSGKLSAGTHSLALSERLADGVYVVKLVTPERSATTRLVVTQ